MTEKESALHSSYIIDGVRMDMTPAELLEECMEYDESHYVTDKRYDDIIDESTEPPLSSFKYDESEIMDYLSRTLPASSEERSFRMLYPEHFTRLQIAKTLLSRLWSEGHFYLNDLHMWAQWEWNTRPIGNMAAFYQSVQAASGYIYDLGVKLEDYLLMESDETSSAKFYAWIEEDSEDPSEENDHHPWISESRKCPSSIIPDKSSWMIYIPFDTCSYKIGGSLLAQTNGHNGGKAPSISDPDYFIDCYEVVREMVEDGIIMSGVTVADGGLMTAAARMCGENGIDLNIEGIASSYNEQDRVRILFGEVPGVLLQISDENYDYLDSQFLLQDIAYYPVGRAENSFSGVRISKQSRIELSSILTSLMGTASEGED